MGVIGAGPAAVMGVGTHGLVISSSERRHVPEGASIQGKYSVRWDAVCWSQHQTGESGDPVAGCRSRRWWALERLEEMEAAEKQR